MQVLIIKTSSMGDIIHSLPALTDACNAIPGIQFDWVVEKSFVEIPAWHPAVRDIIPIQIRRWRKKLLQLWPYEEALAAIKKMRATPYDAVIDAQGLIKSAITTIFSRGKKHGFARCSAREPSSFHAYKYKHSIDQQQHAIDRIRQLFAASLNYSVPNTIPDANIDLNKLSKAPVATDAPYIVLLHGTTWPSKHWPETYWQQLVTLLERTNIRIYIPWGNEAEKQRADNLATLNKHAQVLPKCKLAELAMVLAHAKAVVAVDTGFGHLCAALGTPTLSLYGPTNPEYVGTKGLNQEHLAVDYPCAPCTLRTCQQPTTTDGINPACFTTITPERVINALHQMIGATQNTASTTTSPDPTAYIK